MRIYVRSLFVLFCMALFAKSNAQDATKIREIDSLVSKINSSDYSIKRDTLSQNVTSLNTNIQRILSTYFKGKNLVKHINYANILNLKANDTIHTVGENIFYYDHNSLIKVDEYFTENGIMKMSVSWYFAKGHLLNYVLIEPKSSGTDERIKLVSNARAEQLLIMSEGIIKDFNKQ